MSIFAMAIRLYDRGRTRLSANLARQRSSAFNEGGSVPDDESNLKVSHPRPPCRIVRPRAWTAKRGPIAVFAFRSNQPGLPALLAYLGYAAHPRARAMGERRFAIGR